MCHVAAKCIKILRSVTAWSGEENKTTKDILKMKSTKYEMDTGRVADLDLVGSGMFSLDPDPVLSFRIRPI